MFSASNFGCTEPVLDPCAQGRISQMTLRANKISLPHANPNVLLFQAQDVHSDHNELPGVYLACQYTLRCSNHIFWLPSTHEQEAERWGCWKTISCTCPHLQLLHGLEQEENKVYFRTVVWKTGRTRKKQISIFNKDLRETFSFNADWRFSMRRELTLFSPFCFSKAANFLPVAVLQN